MEEEHADERRKQLYDEYPVEDGWKVSGTVQDNQNYKRPPFIQETIQVRRDCLDIICIEIPPSSTRIEIN